MRHPTLFAGSASLALAFTPPAKAQQPDGAEQDAYHQQLPSNIVIIALIPRKEGDIPSGTSIVTGEELARDLRTTIGDTLAHQSGVSSTSFGPNASRPILRGFQGDRVRTSSMSRRDAMRVF